MRRLDGAVIVLLLLQSRDGPVSQREVQAREVSASFARRRSCLIARLTSAVLSLLQKVERCREVLVGNEQGGVGFRPARGGSL